MRILCVYDTLQHHRHSHLGDRVGRQAVAAGQQRSLQRGEVGLLDVWLSRLGAGGQIWTAGPRSKSRETVEKNIAQTSKTNRHWGFPCDPSTQY